MMIRKFSHIRGYGCSYTAGDELLDASILYRLGNEDEIDNLKRTYTNKNIFKFRNKYYNSNYVDPEWINNGEFNRYKQITEEQKLSWVRHLADIFDVSYDNMGWGGASIDYCIYKYEEDLINGKINDDDLIIFCAPVPARHTHLTGTGELVNSIYNFPDTWITSKLYDQMAQYYCNTYDIYWNYFYKLKYIEMLNQTRGNVLVFFSQIKLDNLKAFYLDDITNHPVDKMVDSISNFSSIIKDGPDFVPKDQEIRHGFGHCKIERHVEVANQLADYIRKLL